MIKKILCCDICKKPIETKDVSNRKDYALLKMHTDTSEGYLIEKFHICGFCISDLINAYNEAGGVNLRSILLKGGDICG